MNEPADPTRFADSASAASGSLQAMFRAARRDVPSDLELASLSRRLHPLLAAAPHGGGLASKPLLGKAVAVLALAGAAATGVFVATRSDPPLHTAAPSVAPPAQRPDNEAPPRALPAPPASEAEAAPAGSAEPTRSDSAQRAAPSVSQRAPSKASGLGEAALLERARRALDANPSEALALTRRHQARFPKGVLKQEREVIAIEALRRLGRSADAKDRAHGFEKQYPDSPHRRAVGEGLAP